ISLRLLASAMFSFLLHVGWLAREAEVRGQRSEVRGQRSGTSAFVLPSAFCLLPSALWLLAALGTPKGLPESASRQVPAVGYEKWVMGWLGSFVKLREADWCFAPG